MDHTPSQPGSTDEYFSNCRILPCGEDLFPTLSLDPRPNFTTFCGRSPAPTDTQFPVIKGWLNECVEHHGSTCSRPMLFPEFQKRSSLSFARMIDLQDWCLVDISPTSLRFFAMSYAWGRAVPYRTFTANLHPSYHPGHFRQVFTILPATVRDTMTLLVALGERYLWCDSLCILQDSYEDWSYWAAHMNEIYQFAFAFAIARSGAHCNAGLFDAGHPWHTEERVADNLSLISVPIVSQEKKHGMAFLETRG
ncbi:hypothetical protein SMAC4_14143 [Sordaria macrospora]|uniref:uncharacterized protein n=1 Tax=Sordaria macrospora TaxID=5147 RepID=UPI001D257E80|nr:hypothetical protein B0T09DRAFT_252897 [Sordaria sp. MPI-SDFR-AT-0083]WPJ67283.1 hypothetical protein SMAC4_14143 [Sordaria macrospora]